MSAVLAALFEERIAQGPGAQVVSFSVAGRLHACDVALVEEVVLDARLRDLPDMPAEVAGVLSLRGELVPVLDLARLLALPPAVPATASECAVLLLGLGEHRVGLRVERTGEVLFLAPAAVQLATPAERERYPGCLGVARSGAGLLTLIDPVVILETYR